MATEQKLSVLPAAGAIAAENKIPVNQSDVTKLAPMSSVKTFVLSGGASGTFTTADVPAKTVTVVNGVITSIS